MTDNETVIQPAGEPGVVDQLESRRTSAWDIRNAPKNYLSLMLYQGGAAAFAFAAVWVITHQVGKAGYGVVVAVIAASQIAQIFTNWTTVAVVKYGVEEFVDSGVIARTFWSRSLILGVNLAGMLLLIPIWFPWLNRVFDLDPSIWWTVIAHFAITAVWVHVQMGLQAAKLLRVQGLLQMIERLIVFIGISALYLSGHLEIPSAILCYIIGAASMALAGVVMLRRFIFRRFALDLGFFKKLLVYSIPLLPYWFIGFLSGNYVDSAFVKKFLSESELGVYGIAIAVNGIVLQAPTIANTLLLPLFLTQQAETGGGRSYFFFRDVLPGAVLGWGLGCAALSFAAWFGIPLVFKPEFAPAGLPLWVLLAGSVFWIPVAVGYAALANAVGSTYMSLVASIFAAAVNISGDFYLIPRYGLVGCAWGTLLAYATSIIVFSILLKRSAGVPVSWIFTAFVPSIIGALIITFVGSPWLAIAASAVTGFMIALLHRSSLQHTWTFVMNLKGAAREAS